MGSCRSVRERLGELLPLCPREALGALAALSARGTRGTRAETYSAPFTAVCRLLANKKQLQRGLGVRGSATASSVPGGGAVALCAVSGDCQFGVQVHGSGGCAATEGFEIGSYHRPNPVQGWSYKWGLNSGSV